MAPPPHLTEPTPIACDTVRGLVDAITDDWRTHDRDWRMPGFRALIVHRLGTFRRALPDGIVRKSLAPLASGLERRISRRYGIELKSTATVGRGVKIAHQGGIIIHGRAIIGDGCIIRQGVTLGDGVRHSKTDRPILGAGVSLGAGAMVIGACQIGDGAHIGPNAVVQSNIPDGATVVAPRSRVIPLPSSAQRRDVPSKADDG